MKHSVKKSHTRKSDLTVSSNWQMQVRRKFSGQLAEQLPPIVDGFSLARLANEEAFQVNQWREREELVRVKRKLVLLEYGIDGEWTCENAEILARRLLREFVPGFDVADPNKPTRPGRPDEWTILRESALVHAMMVEKQKSPRLNKRQLAAKLAKREPWKTFCSSMENPSDTLRRRDQTARKAKRSVILFARVYEDEGAGRRPPGSYDEIVQSVFSPSGVIAYR